VKTKAIIFQFVWTFIKLVTWPRAGGF